MSYTTIELEILERKAVLTLNRPQAMNAMDIMMMQELADCLEKLHQEPDVQVLIVKGEGRVFSAGGDIKMMLSANEAIDFEATMSYITRFTKAYYTLPMLTIAQIHGAAAGLALSLALASDVIVAEESSKLAMNFIGIGLVPDGGGHFFMKERLGVAKAKQLIWEGKVMEAQEAFAQGLIDYAVSDGASAATVDQIVGKVLASPIAAMLATKQILHAEKLPELERILQAEASAQAKMRATKDHQEGITAFVEKRQPNFIGQ
ncbi:enoyl-CoA hydratase [Bacillus ndiopicus]|uniref:enoyl-CoA hydratase n=1 Tax=Bacillus ndiopicus TaxID=1347368 RepID=UPI0005AAE0F0|nr:enoyl-CoA hydratase [Bacillus ndiopicus]